MANITKDEIGHLFYDMIRKNVRETYEEQKKTYNSKLESIDMYMERKENEAMQAGKLFIGEISEALHVIVREFTAHHDTFALEQLSQGFRSIASSISTNPDTWHIDPTKTMANIFGYGKPLLEKIYQIGHSCFTQGHIDEAHKVMDFLLLLDPGFSASWIALGMILKVKKHWQECIAALQMASQIDPHNPIPHFHTALCYEALDCKKEAKEALQKAFNEAKERPEHRELVYAIQAEINKT